MLELDPAHTQISFTLDATFHTVHGTFQLKRGSVRFNSDGGVASGVVVIDKKGDVIIREFVKQKADGIVLREYKPQKRDITIVQDDIEAVQAVAGVVEG